MRLTYHDGRERFEVTSVYEDRFIPQRAGFTWDKEFNVYFSTEALCASRMTDVADEFALERIVASGFDEPSVMDGPLCDWNVEKERFEWIGAFDENYIAKDARFRWSRSCKLWYTSEARFAAALRKFATPIALDVMSGAN